jgi:hypothetical protein
MADKGIEGGGGEVWVKQLGLYSPLYGMKNIQNDELFRKLFWPVRGNKTGSYLKKRKRRY